MDAIELIATSRAQCELHCEHLRTALVAVVRTKIIIRLALGFHRLSNGDYDRLKGIRLI